MGDKGTAIYSGDHLQRAQSNINKKSKKCYECSGKKKKKETIYYNIILDREATRLIINNSKNTDLNEHKVRRLKISPSVSSPNSVDHY